MFSNLCEKSNKCYVRKQQGIFNLKFYYSLISHFGMKFCYFCLYFGININEIYDGNWKAVLCGLKVSSKTEYTKRTKKEVIMAINLILFGFIVYTALIIVPSIWEELTTEG